MSVKRLDPVVHVVWNSETREFIEDGTVADAIKSFGEIQCVNYDVCIILKMTGDCMEEVNKGCCGGCAWLKGKLVCEVEA